MKEAAKIFSIIVATLFGLLFIGDYIHNNYAYYQEREATIGIVLLAAGLARHMDEVAEIAGLASVFIAAANIRKQAGYCKNKKTNGLGARDGKPRTKPGFVCL